MKYLVELAFSPGGMPYTVVDTILKKLEPLDSFGPERPDDFRNGPSTIRERKTLNLKLNSEFGNKEHPLK